MRRPLDLVRACNLAHVLRPLQIVCLIRLGRDCPDDVEVAGPDDGLLGVERAQVSLKVGGPVLTPIETLELGTRVRNIGRDEETGLEFEREASRASVLRVIASPVGEAKDRRRDGFVLADDGDLVCPVPVRVPFSQELEIRIVLEDRVGVLLVNFGDREDVRVLCFDVQAEAELRGNFASMRVRHSRLRASERALTFHFSALQVARPATFHVAI